MLSKASVDDLKKISDKLDFRCAENDLTVYQTNVNRAIEVLNQGYDLNPSIIQANLYDRDLGRYPTLSENPYNAWYWICHLKSKQSGILSGKKIGIKDNIAVAGIPMMCGSKVLEGFVPLRDATVVSRILNCGGEILGKTTCEDMCISCASYASYLGPVRNPLDPTRITGGSSSGCAAALVTGEIDMGVGSDQGGSIRMPSSCCGLVGLKPTFGLVPYTGCASMTTCIDHVGPMARNVTDCALLLEAMAGFDDCKDSRQPQFEFDVPQYSKEILKPCNNLRIGILLESFDVCEPDVIKCVQKAVKQIKTSAKFASVEDVSIPLHKEVSKIYDLVKPALYYQYMEGAGFGIGSFGILDNNLTEKLYQGVKTRSFAFQPTVKRHTITAACNEELGIDRQFYARGSSMVYHLRKAYDKFLENKVDVLILPTVPHTASKIQSQENLRDYLHFAGDLLDNTKSFNITHHPALSLNAGYSEKDNLAVGMEIVGKMWCDATVLQVAYTIENILKQTN